MNKLDLFVENLCGVFNNYKQVNFEVSQGNRPHPKSRHINGVCNDKIKNLPKDFKGYFIIEESYYEQFKKDNKERITTIQPHLFLFTENDKENIVLNSYELPKDIAKKDFRNDNKGLEMDFNELKLSQKFTPMIYDEIKDNEFIGNSESEFAPGVTFTLKEKILKDTLIVSEVMRKNEELVFGWEDPIIYIKVSAN